MSFSAFLIYYQKSQQITDYQETGRCHSDRAYWPRTALATTAQHPVQGGPHPSDGNRPARRGWTRSSRQSCCQGSCLLAALTSDMPAAGKSSITSNATTSGSNSVVLAEGRLACPLFPPHSPALLHGDFRLPAPSIHHVFSLSRYKPGCSLRGWQNTEGTPTPYHRGSHQIPEISNTAPAVQGWALQPQTLMSPIFWL